MYFHPLTLALWAASLGILIQWSGVWRNGDWGRLMLFTASLTAGFLLVGEMINRGRFEDKAFNTMKSDLSLQDIQKYFGKDRFLVATLGEPNKEQEVIGVVGLQVEGRVAVVKHWDVKAKYRNRGLGWDLLEMVIERNKGTKKHPVQRIECKTYNLQIRAEKTLKDHGFERTGKDVSEPGFIGWFGVKTRTWVKKI